MWPWHTVINKDFSRPEQLRPFNTGQGNPNIDSRLVFSALQLGLHIQSLSTSIKSERTTLYSSGASVGIRLLNVHRPAI
jgi:hypothetical protein